MPNSVYSRLSRLPFLRRRYAAKFLFVAFIGIHLPLISTVLYIIFAKPEASAFQVTLIVLAGTLLATACTLFILNKLLKPIHMSKIALEEYFESGKLPTLPTHYADEAGKLMTKIRETVNSLHNHIEEKQDLAALLAHDLRTPFTQMMGIFEIIKLEDNKDTIDSYCSQMIVEGRKQLKFLEYIMDQLTAAPNASPAHEKVYMSLTDLLNRAIDNVQEAAKKKGVSLVISVKNNPLVEVDENVLLSAVTNVLSNAIKFSFPKGLVELSASISNEMVNIRIKDRGIGFGAEEEKILFKRFVKGMPGTQGESSTGFGLYFAKYAIEKHGGSIRALSEGHGKGAEFDIVLPIAA